MADLVLGVGTSHGPLLNTPPREWDQRAAADRANRALVYRGAEYAYDELLALRAPGFAEACAPAERLRRHTACRQHIEELGRRIKAAELDVLVVVSSDHKEVFGDELLPQFAFYWGDTMRHEPFTQEQLDGMKPGLAIAEVANVPDRSTVRPGDAALARYLIEQTSAAGFDPAASRTLPAGEWGNSGIPHGWGFLFQQVLGGGATPPTVPVFVNTFWEPNPPSAARCFDFGVALGEAVRRYPRELRVGIVASGGLSHFVVDEELDRAFIAALAGRDERHLRSLPDAVLRSGTSELRNWIVVAGALHASSLTTELVGYEPCYRSEAGTGCAMAFMTWQDDGHDAAPGARGEKRRTADGGTADGGAAGTGPAAGERSPAPDASRTPDRRPPDDSGLVSRLRALDSCAVSDALDAYGIQSVVLGPEPVWPVEHAVAGRVRTVSVGARRASGPAGHVAAAAVDISGPEDVLVIAGGGRTDVSCWGGILSRAAVGRGIAGVVVDGACRDARESRDLGLPVFARAVVPVSARGRVVQHGMDEPVAFGGVTVRPGDYVIADGDGVAFVPGADAHRVIGFAERIVAREAAMAEAVGRGRPVTEVMHDSRFPAVEETGTGPAATAATGPAAASAASAEENCS